MFKKPKKFIDSDSFFEFIDNNSNIGSESISKKEPVTNQIKTENENIKTNKPIDETIKPQIKTKTNIYTYIGDDIPWLF